MRYKVFLRSALLLSLPLFLFSHRPVIQQKESEGWISLFNGKDLTGWKQVGAGEHYVKDGLICSKGGMGLLYYTAAKWGNCTLRVVFKMQKSNSNSGVFIRIPIEPREAWKRTPISCAARISSSRRAPLG